VTGKYEQVVSSKDAGRGKERTDKVGKDQKRFSVFTRHKIFSVARESKFRGGELAGEGIGGNTNGSC